MNWTAVSPEAAPSPSPPRACACNVVLIGLMGSGKSTVGRLMAQSLGFNFVDTDQLIIEQAQMSIPDIFSAEGESGFRERETAALRSLQGEKGCVIATGGGIVIREENVALIQRLGFVIWLKADPGVLHQRTVRSDDRPLLRQGDATETLRQLYEVRRPLYKLACDMKVRTDELSPQDVAYGLAESVKVHFRHLYEHS